MSARSKPISKEQAGYWAEIRKQFYLKEDVTYLQGGSVGPSARPTIEYVIDLLRKFESDPLYNQRFDEMQAIVEDSRDKVADFVGTDSRNLALVLNTTMGMNIPAQGLPLSPGSEILMSDQEYPSVQYMWDYMARQQNVLVRKIPIPTPPESPQDIVDAYAAHINDRTRVMIFSHVYCTTGLVAPVKALTELAHKYGAHAVVDGAHAVGMSPTNLDDFGCDFYVSSCHKWLLAPKGTGIAYISPELITTIRPPVLGYNLNPHAHGSRFDVTGTSDLTHFAGLGKAIDYQMEIGWEDKIRPYCLSLAKYLRTLVLDEIEGTVMTIPEGPEMSGFLTSFYIEGVPLHKMREILWNDYDIQIATTGADGRSIFRISTHFYDNFDDIDRFIDALKDVIANRRDDLESGGPMRGRRKR